MYLHKCFWNIWSSSLQAWSVNFFFCFAPGEYNPDIHSNAAFWNRIPMPTASSPRVNVLIIRCVKAKIMLVSINFSKYSELNQIVVKKGILYVFLVYILIK